MKKESADYTNQRSKLQTGSHVRKRKQDDHSREKLASENLPAGEIPQFMEGYGVRQRDLFSKQSMKI